MKKVMTMTLTFHFNQRFWWHICNSLRPTAQSQNCKRATKPTHQDRQISRQLTYGQEGRTANIALAIWRGDEYILNFLFANQLRFRQTNNAEQQNKQ